ncbi:MANSC domain-containing protein 1 [Myxocyprinus asiaticus]|uniref:MANSC domain-containing protein 1 n=1 Tax=Myxocyprinus asiaticus TaxID=70543 RepID=UPI002222EFFD|nr:MANSC domain-containing protein 1 [Myxocyprinus asiaticus]
MWASVLLTCVLLHTCSGASDTDKETCYSRQHRDVIVDVRFALANNGTIMSPREKPSEKDCILSCCSEDVTPGVKCNLVVYKPPEDSSGENCIFFHCPSEQDCPLMVAKAGINTYNIFKGLTHPATKVNGRTTAKLTTTTTTPTPTTTTTTPTTTTTITTTTTSTTKPTTTTTPPPTTQTTTTTTTTTLTTPATTNTTNTPESTEGTFTESAIILVTMAMTPPTTTTTTTTTQSTTTTTTTPSTTKRSTSTTSTKAPRAPQHPPVKTNRPKKPSKPLRGPEPHVVKPVKVTKMPTTQPITTTTTQKPTTTTTTTTVPTTTTTTAPAATERTTAVVLEIENDSKERSLDRDSLVPPVLGSAPGKPKVSRMMWKNSLVAIVVITLVFLVLILALVARKAMESFDRRHYTRLELNDLHYEI